MPAIFSALVTLALQLVSGPLAAFSGPEDFQGDGPGKAPAGWSSEVGRWEVVQDGANRVLAQLARNPNETFNVALKTGSRARNIDLSVRLRAMSGDLDRGGGLVWRAKDAKNYYIARYNPLEDNFRVYKVVDGVRTQLATAEVPGDREWHTLRITMFDDAIACYLDGKKHLQAKDATFPGHGMYGLWTKSDARTSFDDLSAKAFE